MHKRLLQLEASFWDVEAQTVALSREVDDVLTTYDSIVALLSQKCIQWEEVLLCLTQKKEKEERQ